MSPEYLTSPQKTRTYSRPKASMPEPALFEDLPEPSKVHPRGRVRRTAALEEEEEEAPQEPREFRCQYCSERYGAPAPFYKHLNHMHPEQMAANRAKAEAKKVASGSGAVEDIAEREPAVEQSAEEEPQLAPPPEFATPEEEPAKEEVEEEEAAPEEDPMPERPKRKRVAPAAAAYEEGDEPIDDEDADEDFRPSAAKKAKSERRSSRAKPRSSPPSKPETTRRSKR